MAFANYRYTESDGERYYSRSHAVSLVGANGLLATFIKSLKPDDRDDVRWELSGSDLSRLACPDCTNTNKDLLLDLYPEGLTEVCLHRVEKIVGVSSDDWTDAVLVTRPILLGGQEASAAEIKRAFTAHLPFPSRENMEAFGIKGGYKMGSYGWTRPKMNIGAAVCGGGSSSGRSLSKMELCDSEPIHVCSCGTH